METRSEFGNWESFIPKWSNGTLHFFKCTIFPLQILEASYICTFLAAILCRPIESDAHEYGLHYTLGLYGLSEGKFPKVPSLGTLWK